MRLIVHKRGFLGKQKMEEKQLPPQDSISSLSNVGGSKLITSSYVKPAGRKKNIQDAEKCTL